MTGENGQRRRGAARHQGSDLQVSAWQEGAALKNNELTCAMLRVVDHARPWWPDSRKRLQRRDFGKRLQHMGGTGPQTRPQIHPPPTYSARPPCMHQRTHRLHMQAFRRCPPPPLCGCMLTSKKASTHWGFKS